MKIETGHGIVCVEMDGKEVVVIGNVETRRFKTLAAAKKFCRKNVELKAGDEVDDYILSLKK